MEAGQYPSHGKYSEFAIALKNLENVGEVARQLLSIFGFTGWFLDHPEASKTDQES